MLFGWIAIIGLFGAGVYFFVRDKIPKKKRQQMEITYMRKAYGFFTRFFVTHIHITSIYNKLAKLSIYRRDELQVEAAKLLIKSWAIGIGMAVISFLLFNDLLTILICVLFGIILVTITVDKKIDKEFLKVLKALAHTISNMREEYLQDGSVVQAIENVSDNPVLKRPLEAIAQILTSTDAELKLQEFCETTPYRTIQTLAGICYHINNQGDDVDVHGQSNFLTALNIMLSDVHNEIQKNTYRNKLFGYLEYVPIAPIFFMGFMEDYLTSVIPGTALIYNGQWGYLFRTLTVVLAIIAYVMITRINSTLPFKEDDRSPLIIRLLEKKRFAKFISNITPKNLARQRLDLRLKIVLSRKTPEQYTAEKFFYALTAFVLSLLCIISAISLGKEFLQTSTQSLSLVATDEMDAYSSEALSEMDNLYLADPGSFSEIQLTQLVQSYMPGLTDLQVQEQTQRLQTKAKSLENAYFHWWYFWIAVAIGGLGWSVPHWLLKLRAKLIFTEEEDDVLQLQTLVSILMTTNMDTLDLLSELAQNSRTHKDMFEYAYHAFPSDPELEISRLQSKTDIVEFKRFLGKMKLTITDLSVREAYGDLLLERDHILRIRDMVITQSIHARRTLCGRLSMIPLFSMVIGTFLLPIGILGFNEFVKATSMF